MPDFRPYAKIIQPDPYLDKLVQAASECAEDGVFCSSCPVMRGCRSWWDTTVSNHGKISKKRFLNLVSILKSFQKRKRE